MLPLSQANPLAPASPHPDTDADKNAEQLRSDASKDVATTSKFSQHAGKEVMKRLLSARSESPDQEIETKRMREEKGEPPFLPAEKNLQILGLLDGVTISKILCAALPKYSKGEGYVDGGNLLGASIRMIAEELRVLNMHDDPTLRRSIIYSAYLAQKADSFVNDLRQDFGRSIQARNKIMPEKIVHHAPYMKKRDVVELVGMAAQEGGTGYISSAVFSELTQNHPANDWEVRQIKGLIAGVPGLARAYWKNELRAIAGLPDHLFEPTVRALIENNEHLYLPLAMFSPKQREAWYAALANVDTGHVSNLTVELPTISTGLAQSALPQAECEALSEAFDSVHLDAAVPTIRTFGSPGMTLSKEYWTNVQSSHQSMPGENFKEYVEASIMTDNTVDPQLSEIAREQHKFWQGGALYLPFSLFSREQQRHCMDMLRDPHIAGSLRYLAIEPLSTSFMASSNPMLRSMKEAEDFYRELDQIRRQNPKLHIEAEARR